MEKDIKDYLTPEVLLILFLLAVSLMIIFPVLNMVILGAILAYGIRPVARKVQSKIKNSSLSILVAMGIVLIPLILLLVYIVFELSLMVSWILANSSAFNVDTMLLQLSNYTSMQFDANSINSSLESGIRSMGSYILNYTFKLVGSLANITLDLFILVCSVFYFVRDGDRCFSFIRDFVPEDSMDFFNSTVESVKNVLNSIFYGHILTSAIIGIFACVGYSLLGYPFGIFLGIVTGIMQLVPVLGPWVIYWVLIFIDVISGNYVRAGVVLVFGLFLSSADMYIRPALSSRYADIHPLILLIGFLAGPLVYGIVGFIVGPLILGITYAVIDSFRKEYLVGDE